MRAYGPNRLRALRMAKALGGIGLRFFFLSQGISFGGWRFSFFSALLLPFLIFTVVHDVSPMVIEIGGHIRMKQILREFE